MPKFTILHLYPNTLHLNGEVGNVVALVERGKASGLEVAVQSVELGENLPTEKPDLIFIGSGILSAVKVASVDLEKKSPKLIDWVGAGAKVLAVGAGFDLISKGLEVEPGQTLFGLGLADTRHRITNDHLVGEVVTESGLAGFINWNREIVRGGTESILATVSSSNEAQLVGYQDGYRTGNIIATNIQGPFLPMNPSVADELLGISGKVAKRNATLNQLAEKSREAISRRVNR
ncbi:MAG: hypothetical protein RLZ53_163 [Actinomycetota bacterium]|jgi:CobQ-like glutamine amidotransferase family enzyme